MTALKKFDRLEATGLWRSAPDARLREVVVGLRNTTLLLSDPKTEAPLTQWSLPALRRLNGRQMPALFAPSDDGEEELELADPEMVAALETVHTVLEKRQSRPGRLRLVLSLSAALALIGLVVFVLPGRLVDYTASVLPGPSRAALGDAALEDLGRLTGSPCAQVQGRSAGEGLMTALFPDAATRPRLAILREALPGPRLLPGPVIALPRAMLDDAAGPEEIAGALLLTAAAAPAEDPMRGLLTHAGLFPTIQLLTTGTAPDGLAAGYAETVLAPDLNPYPDPAAAPALAETFRAAGLSTLPWAEPRANGSGPEADLARALLAADPFPEGGPRPVMEDGDWLMLQAICG